MAFCCSVEHRLPTPTVSAVNHPVTGDSEDREWCGFISAVTTGFSSPNLSLGLWACTAECKILGHSDRCWSPSCGRANPHPSPHPSAPLSTFCKSTSLPRDPLRRDNFYQAQLPKTVGLQSVYEKVLHRDFDRTITLLSPPRPARLPDLQEIGVPLFPAPSTRYLGPQTEVTEKA